MNDSIKNISFFGDDEEVPSPKEADLKKRSWEKGFQRWCDNSFKGSSSSGVCGYGSMCDYCDGFEGKPCVRALNVMLRENGKSIDYSTANFKDVWEGDF